MLEKAKPRWQGAARQALTAGKPSFSHSIYHKTRRVVKSRLSLELDRAIIGVETTTGRVCRAWLVYQRWLKARMKRSGV